MDAHKRYETRYDIYSLGLVLLEIGLWQSIYYFNMRMLSEKDKECVCETHLAHLMGDEYKRAVLLCIGDDDVWRERSDNEDDVARVREVFAWKVLKESSSCVW
jgi:hypothetical protein